MKTSATAQFGDREELLQRLIDIESIKQLKARYFRSLDHKDWDLFGEVFTHEAVLDALPAGLR